MGNGLGRTPRKAFEFRISELPNELSVSLSHMTHKRPTSYDVIFIIRIARVHNMNYRS